MIITLNGVQYATTKNGNTQINFTGKNVQDEKRGYLIFINGNWAFVGPNQTRNLNVQNIEKLALVLESPHIDEFDTNGNPLRPANGKTGLKINTLLAKRPNIISLLNGNNVYEVYLMNPVQYQASCYSVLHQSVTRDNTNQVFRKLFSVNGFNLRLDFIVRLNNYSPNLIINCCSSCGGLKKTVEVAIKASNCFNINNYVADIHPSRW